MSIKVEGVTKIFGKQKALDNVSFSIQSGEIVGFLGPNGAGKSTMMKILTGIMPQTSGIASINEIDVVEDNLFIKEKIGYLPENNPLYEDMYVKEYLTFLTGLYKMTGIDKKQRVESIIEQTGLRKEQYKKIGQLSKGYKQRVGLAQALIHDPDVLILDEPTSGLDPNQIIEIRNLISTVGKDKTVMLSTHIMQEVEAICDRIIIIHQGKIVSDNTTQNIKTKFSENQSKIIVEFDKAVELNDLKRFTLAKSVLQNNNNQIELIVHGKSEIRTAITQYAIKNNLTILSLQQHQQSLEDVFHELTKNRNN